MMLIQFFLLKSGREPCKYIPPKHPINTQLTHYEHMIQGSHFNLASVSKNSILTNLKSAQVSKAAGLDSLSGCFLKY